MTVFCPRGPHLSRTAIIIAAVTLSAVNLLFFYRQRPAVPLKGPLKPHLTSPPAVATVKDTRKARRIFSNRLLARQGEFLLPKLYDHNVSLLPQDPGGSDSDRILNQMRYIPPQYGEGSDIKLIFVEDSNHFNIDISMCPVRRCRFTFFQSEMKYMDAILLRSFELNSLTFLPNQIVIVYQLESPSHFDLSNYGNVMDAFNWTATYRFGSTIVTPYFKVTAYDNIIPWPTRYPYPANDYSVTRKIPIAWFVSNCHTKNKRLKLAKLLGQHMQVDIYGKCGNLSCSRDDDEYCFGILRQYWFYLSFENSNCRHYITEKFFRNALNSSVVPIVLGSHPDDYKLVAPPHSYIHIEDFPSIHLLVKYLKYLMTNNTAYNEYFAWKDHMKVDTNTFFWCRLCTMVHQYSGTKQPDVPEMRKWWQGQGDCLIRTWSINEYW